MKILSIINPKGGVGKTVSSVNIAYALKRKGKKVLLIDTDPRSAIEIYLNIQNDFTLNELLKEQYNNHLTFGKDELKKYITIKNELDVIISSQNLIHLHEFFAKDPLSEYQIFLNIKQYFNDYDYIVIDTEGTINNLSRAVLNATDYIFCPTKTSLIDASGLRDLSLLFDITKRSNPKIELKKIFIVQAKKNTKIYNNTYKELKKFFPESVFSNIAIREDQNILNAMEENKDIFTYKKSSNAAIDYKNLVDEFLQEELL